MMIDDLTNFQRKVTPNPKLNLVFQQQIKHVAKPIKLSRYLNGSTVS